MSPEVTPGSSERWAPFRALLTHPERSVVLSDFDGTLATIVEDPSAAVALPGAPEALVALCRRFESVGVVSGRPARFLLERVGEAALRAPNLQLFGLYGLQWVQGGEIRQDPAVEPWLAEVAAAADAAAVEAPPGIGVERKGLSLALHWRSRPDAAGWAIEFARNQAEQRGLDLQPGRMSLELRPPVPGDKGAVVERLAAGASAACFIGDDVGDLPAFAALDRLGASGGAVVKAAVVSHEMPSELAQSADVVLDGPPEVLAVLEWLAAAAV